MAAKKIIAILASIAAAGTTGLTGIYLYSLENFSIFVEDKKWLKNDLSNEIWGKAQDLYLAKKNEISDFSYLFKNIDEKIKSNINKEKTILKEACLKGYISTHKSIFFEDKILLKNLNTFCRLQIKNLFDDNDLIQKNMEQNSELLKVVNDLLKSHDDKELGSIGENVKNGTYTWDKYKDWCQKWYDSFYTGDNDRNWKIANHYCKKSIKNISSTNS